MGLLLSSFNNKLRALLLGSASFETLAVEALARAGMATGSATFTTTHGVIDRVHNDATVTGATTEPAAATGLTATFQRVFAVTNDAYSCLTS